MKKAVFFDKDGTLIRNVPYNVDPVLIQLNPGAAELVQKLKAADFKLLVVSNQAGVARGLFDEADLKQVWQRLNELCQIEFDEFYFCPHHENGTIQRYKIACDCRKPMPGMLLKAAREHSIDLQNSWMIGDTLSDMEAGRRTGCQTILLDNDETGLIRSNNYNPQFVITNLSQAVDIILNKETEPHATVAAALKLPETKEKSE